MPNSIRKRVQFDPIAQHDEHPAWNAWVADAVVGTITWWPAHKSFAFLASPGVPIRAWALRSIARFMDRMNKVGV